MRRKEIRRYTPGFPLALRAALTLDHQACVDKKENRNKEFNTKYQHNVTHLQINHNGTFLPLCKAIFHNITSQTHYPLIAHTASSV